MLLKPHAQSPYGEIASGSRDQERNKLKQMVLRSAKKLLIYWVSNQLI